MPDEDTVTMITDTLYGLLIGIGLALHFIPFVPEAVAYSFVAGVGLGYCVHVFSNMVNFSTKVGDTMGKKLSGAENEDTEVREFSVSDLSQANEERADEEEERAKSSVFKGNGRGDRLRRR